MSAWSVILSRVTHPNDASYMGTVHGGVILRMLDEAGGMAAFRHARKPVVTAAIDSMSFLAPVFRPLPFRRVRIGDAWRRPSCEASPVPRAEWPADAVGRGTEQYPLVQSSRLDAICSMLV